MMASADQGRRWIAQCRTPGLELLGGYRPLACAGGEGRRAVARGEECSFYPLLVDCDDWHSHRPGKGHLKMKSKINRQRKKDSATGCAGRAGSDSGELPTARTTSERTGGAATGVTLALWLAPLEAGQSGDAECREHI